MGVKNGSTMGRLIAVWRAVRKRRGPTGLGMTMTSGSEFDESPGVKMLWMQSLTLL